MAHKLLLFIFVLTFFANFLLAEEPIDQQMSREQWNVFHEVEANILSPFCPGRLLKDCPSSAARDLKVSIKEKILTGKSATEIQASLIEEYGNELKSQPDHEGFGLLAWYGPAVFLLIGFLVVLSLVRNKPSENSETSEA